MKKRIVFLALLLLGFFCSAQAAPILRIDEPVWNAGIIVTGGNYEKTVTVENAGDEPLIIEKIEECCGFFGKLNGGTRLLPGEKASLVLRLAPFKFVGELKAEISLVSNDPQRPRYSILALGQVMPKAYALGELKEQEIDLGVLDLMDRVPFKVRILSSGNIPLEIRRVEKPATVIETGSRPTVAVGAEGTLTFEYSPINQGPIDDKITIVTNDARDRVMVVLLKGYATRGRVSDHALCFYPVGKKAPYDVVRKSFRYDFTINNLGPVGIEILKTESSLSGVQLEVPKYVGPGAAAEASVNIPLEAGVAGKGFIYLQLAIPIEVQ